MGTKLVQRGEVEKAIAELLEKEEIIKEDIQRTLPYIQDEDLKKTLSKRLANSLECIAALQAGFLPIDDTWFLDVKTKSKWGKKEVADIMATMPDEVKEAWERVEELDVFKKFGVARATRSDPILAGRAGKKWFFIACWVNFIGGYSAGFSVRH